MPPSNSSAAAATKWNPSPRVVSQTRGQIAPLLALRFVLASAAVASVFFPTGSANGASAGIHAPEHRYFKARAQDPFSRWLETQNSEALPEPNPPSPSSEELAQLRTVLKALQIPESSQILVFSATSFQTPLISARNPRAIYFNEDSYVGFVPGGKLEVLSVDPDLGPIFHLLHAKSDVGPVRAERSARCINCHAPEEKGGIPLLVVESMVPGLSGGGEKSFRTDVSGHSIPLSERMGGWHVTGTQFPHRGNLLMETRDGVTREIPLPPGRLFSWERYPVQTSDAFAHLLHEHQVGFINRCVEAKYKLDGNSGPGHTLEIEHQAETLLRYALFEDEAPLPKNGIQPDPMFQKAFLERRISASNGFSLRDLDLGSRLFRYRCSYMIYSNAFTGLPAALKTAFFNRLHARLTSHNPGESQLPIPERRVLFQILRETVPELSSEWKLEKKP